MKFFLLRWIFDLERFVSRILHDSNGPEINSFKTLRNISMRTLTKPQHKDIKVSHLKQIRQGCHVNQPSPAHTNPPCTSTSDLSFLLWKSNHSQWLPAMSALWTQHTWNMSNSRQLCVSLGALFGLHICESTELKGQMTARLPVEDTTTTTTSKNESFIVLKCCDAQLGIYEMKTDCLGWGAGWMKGTKVPESRLSAGQRLWIKTNKISSRNDYN